MNTSKLQKFATDARRQLVNAVGARLDAVLAPDSAARVDQPAAFEYLENEIRHAGGGEQGRRHVVERYAYRWFNRIIAFRYMDVHGFTRTPVVSPADMTSTNALPEVLAAAKRGEYDESTVFEQRVNQRAKDEIEGLFNGSIQADDPQGRAYGLLLQSECRYWSGILPSMFDRIGGNQGKIDEMLMPADLLADGSVVRNAVEAMTPEDCGADDPSGNVEIIGWLYQYYISERKTEVMDGFKKNHKAGADEIPAATQLFTPDWIVRYLVQNTVGRLWMQSHPDSQLYRGWEYYIQPSDEDSAGNEEILEIRTPEDLTVCDPACGSGHMLTYAFDLLYEIYEEEGYAPGDIPGLILEHNLYGMEIDERAADLASFALTMKARSRSRRFFRKRVEPHIQRIAPIRFTDDEVTELNRSCGADLDSAVWNTFEKADVYGSLIQPPTELAKLAESMLENWSEAAPFDLLLEDRVKDVFDQTVCLSRRYAAVVANPPYMGAKNMSDELKKFVQDHYKDGKADLFAAFIMRNQQFIQHGAMLGMITMQSWMFLSSFEDLRRKILLSSSIKTMAHLGAGAFDSIGGEVVSTVAFTLKNESSGGKGVYIRLVDVFGDGNQSDAYTKATRNVTDYRFEVDQREFAQIPGSPIVYWANESIIHAFSEFNSMAVFSPCKGLVTTDNNRYLRFWFEVSNENIKTGIKTQDEILEIRKRWFPLNKGGDYRKWYGNNEYIINWFNNGAEIKKAIIEKYHGGSYTKEIRNEARYFEDSITWSALTCGSPSFRDSTHGAIFDSAGSSMFPSAKDRTVVLGILNSSTINSMLQMINPTLNYGAGSVSDLPVCSFDAENNSQITQDCIAVSKTDWDSFEASWDFQKSALLDDDQGAQPGDSLGEAVSHLRGYWTRVSEEQRQREIRNNELVADAYGVRDDVPCDVPLERVSLKRNVAFAYPKDTPDMRDEKFAQDVIKELISYAVGCMFGRYSLDKPGLILASQGETLDDYHAQIPNPSFEPDAEMDCFEDDIVIRFRRFLAVAFGEDHLKENLAYIERVLGKDLRSYFVNDFYDDHVKMYSNRPIYWQYSSQPSKKGSFKALIYLHRYTPTTTNVVLNYLRDYVGRISDIADGLEQSDRTKDQKMVAKLRKAVVECKDYEDQTLYPLATRNLEMDLDDGVLVNYLRMGKALRTITSIEKKRKDVSTWTWPTHPLKENC